MKKVTFYFVDGTIKQISASDSALLSVTLSDDDYHVNANGDLIACFGRDAVNGWTSDQATVA